MKWILLILWYVWYMVGLNKQKKKFTRIHEVYMKKWVQLFNFGMIDGGSPNFRWLFLGFCKLHISILQLWWISLSQILIKMDPLCLFTNIFLSIDQIYHNTCAVQPNSKPYSHPIFCMLNKGLSENFPNIRLDYFVLVFYA